MIESQEKGSEKIELKMSSISVSEDQGYIRRYIVWVESAIFGYSMDDSAGKENCYEVKGSELVENCTF